MNERELPVSVRLALKELKEALLRLYGERLRGVYLYGSYARGDFSEDSDIDILIALAGEVRPYDETNRLNEMVSNICLHYDVLISTYPVPEAWVRERQNPFFENVRREGVLL